MEYIYWTIVVVVVLNLLISLGIASFIRKLADVVFEMRQQLDEIHEKIATKDLIPPTTPNTGTAEPNSGLIDINTSTEK